MTFSVALLNGAWFSQLEFDNSQAKVQKQYDVSVLKALEALLYVHAMFSMSTKVGNKAAQCP